MILTEFFGLFSLSAFSMWAFLMAFFFNVFVYSLDVKRGTTLLLSSLIMFISYSSYEYFLDWLSIYALTYLDLAIYDGCTIAALLIAKHFIKTSSSSLLYLIFGLSTNLSLALCMQLDTFILRNFYILRHSRGTNYIEIINLHLHQPLHPFSIFRSDFHQISTTS